MRFVVVDDPDHALLASVIALGDKYRDTLGFLPRQAFAERATTGTIIAAEDSGAVLAYALYDLPGSVVRLVHLCVDDGARGRGLARSLVREVEARHPERLRIQLACRRDFPANELWPRLDFVLVAERPGRSKAGTSLTLWHKPLREELSLFDVDPAVEAGRLIAAIDSNVFFDLIDERRDIGESSVLLDDWVADEIELVRTDELLREIDASQDASQRRRARAETLGFRRLRASSAGVDAALNRLLDALDRPSLNERSRADLRHVAHAAAGGADYLVTRDTWLLKDVEHVTERVCSVVVRSPAELVVELDRRRRTGAYAPGLLAKTSLRVEPIAPGQVEMLATRFVSHGHGERRTAFARSLRSLLADPLRCSSRVVWQTDAPMALAVWLRGEPVDEVPVLRAASSWPLASTVARQLLYGRRTARARGLGGSVVVTERYLSPAVERALAAEAFVRQEDAFMCPVLPILASAAEAAYALRRHVALSHAVTRRALAALESEDLTGEASSELERQFWPLKVLDAPLPSYLVPIQPRYAEALFDTGLAEQTLFPRETRLGVAREHVYYRVPRSAGLHAPARLLWYVSGDKRRYGVQSVRAVSRLEEVVIGKPERLYERFRHLGVYELSDVQRVARADKAMALRFGDTERLPTPVPLLRLRHHAEQHGHSLMLRSARRLPPAMFADVYEEGTNAERQP